MKTIGLDMTTLFEFIEILFGLSERVPMGIGEKFGYIRMPNSQKHYYGVVDY